jgi:hypothetical protein
MWFRAALATAAITLAVGADAAAVRIRRNCEWVVARRRAARAPAVSAAALPANSISVDRERKTQSRMRVSIAPSIDAAVEWR